MTWTPQLEAELRFLIVAEYKSKKRLRVIREVRSTTGLSVKKFSEYLEKVLAFGATDLGVVFESDWWE